MPSKIQGYNYQEPAFVQRMLQADAARRLSSKDRANLTGLRTAIQFTPEEAASNIRTELQPYTLKSLDAEIEQAQDPEILKILKDERANVLTLLDEAKRLTQPEEKPSFLDSFLQSIQSLWSSK